MPWAPELFSAPTLQRLEEEMGRDLVTVPFFEGLLTGEFDALVGSSILGTFEPAGYVREPAGGQYLHRGHDGLRAFYELLFSNGGGIPLQHCGLIDDHTACAHEYNVVRWGKTDLPPQAGVAVYVRGQTGKLAAARIYDDVSPPLDL